VTPFTLSLLSLTLTRPGLTYTLYTSLPLTFILSLPLTRIHPSFYPPYIPSLLPPLSIPAADALTLDVYADSRGQLTTP
jgi:hypothetical protein